MTKGIPLPPISKALQRRKSRVCTREACETCREKKAKCDGGKPCSRCQSRGMKCHYQTRPYQNKQALKAELEELKDAQRQRDAVVEALRAPGRTLDVLQLLWNGEPLKCIYETLNTRDSSFSPPNKHSSNASTVHSEDSQEPSPTSPQDSLGLPPSRTHSNSAMSNQTNTSGVHGTTDDHDPAPVSSYGAPNFDEFSTTSGPENLDSMGPSPTASPIEWSTNDKPAAIDIGKLYLRNPYSTDDFGAMNWWTPNTDSMPSSFFSGSSTDSIPWSNTQGTMPPTCSVPSSTPSPMTIASSLSLRPSSREIVRNGVATMKPHGGPAQLPPEKRNSKAEQPFPAGAPVIDLEAIPDPPKSPGASPAPRQEACRERHHRASARNWQRKKQTTTDLQAAKNNAEALNKELQRQRAEVMNQVISAKNALMDHAKCNHPAISSWLSSQATSYVLDLVNTGDGDRKGGRSGAASEASAAAHPTAEFAGAACR